MTMTRGKDLASISKRGKKMRLIDADALEKKLNNERERFVALDMKGAEHILVHSALRLLREAPTIDAVPVVRCGECKYLMASGVCNMFADDNIKPSASDFCSYGERKDDDKSCDTCKHYDKGWDDIICDGCTKAHSNWERKDDDTD